MSIYTAIGDVFKAVRRTLIRNGVNVGTTADYPRVELHSFVENPPLDKDGDLRSIDLVIESLGDKGLGDVVTLVTDNLARLFGNSSLSQYLQGWAVVGVVQGAVRMLEEQTVQDQNIVLYRMLQDVTVWVERKVEEETSTAE